MEIDAEEMLAAAPKGHLAEDDLWRPAVSDCFYRRIVYRPHSATQQRMVATRPNKNLATFDTEATQASAHLESVHYQQHGMGAAIVTPLPKTKYMSSATPKSREAWAARKKNKKKTIKDDVIWCPRWRYDPSCCRWRSVNGIRHTTPSVQRHQRAGDRPLQALGRSEVFDIEFGYTPQAC